MKNEIAHLTAAAVEAIYDEALAAHGGAHGLRDRGMLESAILAPQATMYGEPLMCDSLEIAAAYLCYICLNRPFIDGNKRAALGACLVFLDINGILPDEAITTKNTGSWEQLVLDVAAGKIDRSQTIKRLGSLLKTGGK
jgi:death-on-curing protein